MKALVTGSSGFIGSHVMEELLRQDNDVIGFDRAPSNYADIVGDIVTYDFTELLDDVDVVFHLAGLLGTTELFHRVVEAERVNVEGTLNLLEAMRRTDTKRLVFTSKPNVWPDNVYTITKENCERYLGMYNNVYGMEAVVVKPFNVYGPREPLTEYRKAIPYFIIQSLREEPLEVFGDGRQLMDCVYVEDTARGMIHASEKRSGTYEIASTISLPVRDVAELIIELTNSSSTIEYLPMRRGEGDGGVYADTRIGGTRQLVKNPTPLREGLMRTIKWYDQHLKEFRRIYEFQADDFPE